MPSPEKGKAKKNLARARMVARKEKKATQGKVGHKAADCWYKQTTKSQGKGKGTGKSKSKMAEISKSNGSRQVDETWASNTPAQQPNLSQVNAIGCAEERLWMFSLEDSKKTSVHGDWEDQSVWTTEEHELMIDCLPTLVCTAISNG